jgi:hypothetical protein
VQLHDHVALRVAFAKVREDVAREGVRAVPAHIKPLAGICESRSGVGLARD